MPITLELNNEEALLIADALAMLEPLDDDEDVTDRKWNDCRRIEDVLRAAVEAGETKSEPKQSYSHVYSIAFEVLSFDPEGADTTAQMIRDAIEGRLRGLPDDEIVGACALDDSIPVDPDWPGHFKREGGR